MKKILFIIPIISVIFFACEEDFDPKTTYKERYALNCILRGDTSLQYATILQSYNISGFDPYEHTENPFVAGADVRIWQKNKVYKLRDTLLTGLANSRYTTPIPAYYTNEFIPGEHDTIEIRAILQSGKTLSGGSRMPGKIEFNESATDIIIPVNSKDYFQFNWRKVNSYALYITRLNIHYEVNIAGVKERKSIMMPLEYKMVDGISTPQYPEVSRSSGISFSYSVLDSVFKKISEGDPEKGNYSVIAAIFEVLELDKPLSEYYISSGAAIDDFTVRVDEVDFTNIKGGFGIFGSYIKARRGVAISEAYITSFGYKKFSN
jgi:hypothetical protein